MKEKINEMNNLGLDYDSIRSIINLKKDSKHRKITLVTGAGVSVSSGLPTWNKLLEKIVKIFILHWDFEAKSNPRFLNTVPKNISIAMAEDIFLDEIDKDYVKHLLGEDPLVLAQLIKNCVEERNWNWMLRKSMYDDYSKITISSDLFRALYEFVSNAKSHIDSILTYNYDDYLELYFEKKGLKTQSLVSQAPITKSAKLSIFHLHGILPVYGGLKSEVYLTEDDYLSDIIEPNSWYNQIHASKLTNNICLFTGLSFNDPSLKRKLSVNRLYKDHYHYALLTHEENKYSKSKFLLLKNELLRLNIRVIKYPYTKNHCYLPKVLDLMREVLYP